MVIQPGPYPHQCHDADGEWRKWNQSGDWGLGWFSDKPASMEERGRFFPKQDAAWIWFVLLNRRKRCFLNKSDHQPAGHTWSPARQRASVIRKEILAEQAEPGFIDPDFLMKPISRKGWRCISSLKKLRDRASWMGLDAGNPLYRKRRQLRKLKAAYTEMASIISSRAGHVWKLITKRRWRHGQPQPWLWGWHITLTLLKR